MDMHWYTCKFQFYRSVNFTFLSSGKFKWHLTFSISCSVLVSNIFHLALCPLCQRCFLFPFSMLPEYPFTNYCPSLCIFIGGGKVLCCRNKRCNFSNAVLLLARNAVSKCEGKTLFFCSLLTHALFSAPKWSKVSVKSCYEWWINSSVLMKVSLACILL